MKKTITFIVAAFVIYVFGYGLTQLAEKLPPFKPKPSINTLRQLPKEMRDSLIHHFNPQNKQK